ncbi:hypothetical protein H0H92_013135 [Tricholoma furcatifolium]|nr:hypothetical protein H0H92_013135 [Tricholoma furcatifolium]
MSRVQRGHDPNVRFATPEQEKIAHEMLAEWNTDNKQRPVVVYTIPHGDTTREFLAWKSMTKPKSVIGRCTRAYPVYEEATSKWYFLKDLWRAHDLDPEAKTLEELQRNEVQNVPKFVCGGDIVQETTETDLYVPIVDSNDPDAPPLPDRRNGDWRLGDNWNRITRRIHHCFVVNFIGRPLETFENSEQLMQVVFDAFIGGSFTFFGGFFLTLVVLAHKEAYEKCGIVHRDISAKNILITMNGRGILNDWDLAKHKLQLEKPRRHEITGTWQFMSCLLLRREALVHSIQDDMESFYYVMLYYGLRFLSHNYKKMEVRQLLHEIFDQEKHGANGKAYGGDGKALLLVGLTFEGLDFKFTTEPFDHWWDGTHKAVSEWFAHCRQKSSNANTNAEPLDPSQLGLRNHDAIVKVFQSVLGMTWPKDEHKVDAAPNITEGSTVRSAHKRSSNRMIVNSAGGSSLKRSYDASADGQDSSHGGSKKRRTTKPSATATRSSSRLASQR